MHQLELSVILCAHNPHGETLLRVLKSLHCQTLPHEKWEFILVDNNSQPPLAVELALTAHPNGRIVQEREPGLTPARLRGFNESHSDLSVLVDDDTVLDTDYIDQILACCKKHPQISVGCGQRRAEFEKQPSKDLLPHCGILALGEFEKSWWSNYEHSPSRLPVGAGMWVRRPVWELYASQLVNDAFRRSLDRTGKSLSSCGDHDIALTAQKMGLGTGQFTGPKLTHIISEERTSMDYLLRLRRSVSASSALLEYIHFRKKPRTDLVQKIKDFVTFLRHQKPDRLFYKNHLLGLCDAQKIISSIPKKENSK